MCWIWVKKLGQVKLLFNSYMDMGMLMDCIIAYAIIFLKASFRMASFVLICCWNIVRKQLELKTKKHFDKFYSLLLSNILLLGVLKMTIHFFFTVNWTQQLWLSIHVNYCVLINSWNTRHQWTNNVKREWLLCII